MMSFFGFPPPLGPSPYSNGRPVRAPPSNAQCTHMTMTRLYDSHGSIRCSQCQKVYPGGWLYRCTQDRQLVLEDELEKGEADKFDKLADIFPLQTEPKKRSPGARLGHLSFLEEISDDAVKNNDYTPEQISQILGQRKHLQEKLTFKTSQNRYSTAGNRASYYSQHNSSTSPSPRSPTRGISPTPPAPTRKPWLPILDECMFKICHFCRPSAHERAYLSLNAIADGELPATAIVGYGFNIDRKRPIALAKHVANLGLRVPPPCPTEEELEARRDATILNSPDNPGIGLFDDDSDADTHWSQLSLPVRRTSYLGDNIPAHEYFEHLHSLSRNMSPETGIDPDQLSCTSTSSSMSGNASEMDIATAPRLRSARTFDTLPLAPETQTVPERPQTLMEEAEAATQTFGSEPLKVKDGLALTEEAVERHAADIVKLATATDGLTLKDGTTATEKAVEQEKSHEADAQADATTTTTDALTPTNGTAVPEETAKPDESHADAAQAPAATTTDGLPLTNGTAASKERVKRKKKQPPHGHGISALF